MDISIERTRFTSLVQIPFKCIKVIKTHTMLVFINVKLIAFYAKYFNNLQSESYMFALVKSALNGQ